MIAAYASTWRRSLVAGLTGLLLLSSGCQTPEPPGFQKTLPQFFLESAGAGIPVRLPRSDVQLTVNPRPVLTEADVLDVQLVQVDLGQCLAFRLTSAATRDCYRLTASHQGRRLVLLLNGSPLGARRIEGPITDGIVYMFVELPDSALPKLVADLKLSVAKVQRELGRK